jgi:DNA repair protein RecN (Recombination protein N)
VAQAIGKRLSRAAREHQVLCITHLPQIAAFADAHYRVEKRTSAGRTTTRVVRLSDDERLEELATMLGGARVTEAARVHAAELLDETRRKRRAGPGGRAAQKGAPKSTTRESASRRSTARRQSGR